MRIHLTDLAIRKLPNPKSGDVKYWDTTTPAFGIRCTARTKSFFVVYGVGRRLTTIGRYGEISLSQARTEAKRLLVHTPPKKLIEGLSEAIDAYLSECESKNRPATVDQYRHFLKRVEKPMLASVKRTDVDISSPHAVMAWKVFFNWCIRSELIDNNPFAHIPTKWNTRSRVLNDDEIKAIWSYDFPPYSTHLKLLLLTGQRRGQFAQFHQSWVSEDLIHFPAEVMKSGKPHTLPLTPMVAELLDSHQPYNGWSKAKARIDKFVTIPHWTPHDLRRTHSTIQAKLGTPIHVTEAILAHASGTISGIAAIYNQYDYLKEAREGLSEMEDYISNLVTPLVH